MAKDEDLQRDREVSRDTGVYKERQSSPLKDGGSRERMETCRKRQVQGEKGNKR